MLKKLGFFSLFFIIAGCLEPYEFLIHDASPTLVVEGYLSDKSFNETLLYPSDGRYFTIKLTRTGDVTNMRPVVVNDASVELEASDGSTWTYTPTAPGIYSLLDPDFRARRGIAYKLLIRVRDQHLYESAWEAMPDTDTLLMGQISFAEGEKQVYVMEAKEWVLRSKKVVTLNVDVPENTTTKKIFYRWTYSPTWIYVAPLTSTNDPFYKCWATDQHYLNTYDLQIDKAGGYKKELFNFVTVRNERIFEKFSVLITQHVMTEEYFNFWKEMKEQTEGSALTDTPPYNLKTNLRSATGAESVIGYFGVTAEQAKRWYFTKSDLSYHIENTLKADCLVSYGGPPAEECSDCRFYSFGRATTTKPGWWQD